MRDDIESLPIKKSELAKLTNLEFARLSTFWTVYIFTVVTVILYQTIRLGQEGGKENTIVALIAFSLSLIFPLIGWLKFKKLVSRPPLKGLLSDIKRFNYLIKSIHINDQLEEAGNLSVMLKDRERITEALKLTREDLCRALKTERILRENKKFIAGNPALFENNLIALTTLQVDDQASEQGRLLDEALQIALSTQEELRKFQKRDY